MPGSGTVTPITSYTSSIGQLYPQTLLSLPRYAGIMGINPVHFQGAYAGNIFPVSPNRNNDVWPQYPWQANDRVARFDLAHAIASAEEEIANYLGYWPGPTWIEQEVRDFPHYYRRDLFRVGGGNVRGARVGINTKWGKIISPGQRAVSLIDDEVVVAYTDEDGDGWSETATVSVTTTLSNVCEIKVYHEDKEGQPEWEIRPPRSKSISGGTCQLVFDSWLFIDPDIQGRYPTDEGWSAINISTTANYVTKVDVYREYTDTTGASAMFYWEPTPQLVNGLCSICGGAGCQACVLTTQDGCLHIRDANMGIVVPQPATYDSDEGAWESAAFTVCRDPDFVKLYYYAGMTSDRWRNGTTCDPLSRELAEAIAWMATARLERPFCAGTVAEALSIKMQTDLSMSHGDTSFFLAPGDLANPFGTRHGEVLAWRRVNGIAERRMMGVAV